MRITSPPPGFDTRTVQYVASRYTDYANPGNVDDGDLRYKGMQSASYYRLPHEHVAFIFGVT